MERTQRPRACCRHAHAIRKAFLRSADCYAHEKSRGPQRDLGFRNRSVCQSRFLANYIVLNSPVGIWPVRKASAAWARTAARSAVDL